MDETINVLQRHINNEFAKIDAGTITTLSAQTMSLIDKLVCLTSLKNGVCPSASDTQNTAASPSLAHTFVEALSSKPKRVVITSQDVEQVPRLTGAADVDVISCLSQYCLVCSFRVKANTPASLSDVELIKLSDQVAFEYLSLICDGPVLQLYQHIMDGSINWHVPQMSTGVTDAPGFGPS